MITKSVVTRRGFRSQNGLKKCLGVRRSAEDQFREHYNDPPGHLAGLRGKDRERKRRKEDDGKGEGMEKGWETDIG